MDQAATRRPSSAADPCSDAEVANKIIVTTHSAMNDESSSSVSSSSSSSFEFRFSKLNDRVLNTLKKSWSFKKNEEKMANRQRSHSAIGMCGGRTDLDHLAVNLQELRRNKSQTPPPSSYSIDALSERKNSTGVAEFLARLALQLTDPITNRLDESGPNTTPLVVEDPPTESDGSSDDGVIKNNLIGDFKIQFQHPGIQDVSEHIETLPQCTERYHQSGFEGSVIHPNQTDGDDVKEANNNNVEELSNKDRNRRSLLGIGRDFKRSSKKKTDDRENMGETLNEEDAFEAVDSVNPKEFKRSFSDKPTEFTKRFGASLIRKTRSTGNFSSAPASLLGVSSGAGGPAPPRSAPSTPHQQLEAPLRSPSHSNAKYENDSIDRMNGADSGKMDDENRSYDGYSSESNSTSSSINNSTGQPTKDRNGSKSSWSQNESAGGIEGPLAAPPPASKARQKKFNRHFPQAAQDERVLNYYSCALVGDILLQGHLYITKNYFAFYSNVFGYVTKLLIPTVTVIRVSKEKMARIIPNAVGVTTSDEKHVFASLLSRDATYKLMTQVWNASPVPIPESLMRSKELRSSKNEFEPASELSFDDESSLCSQSGGEESTGINGSKSGSRLSPPVRSHRTPSPKILLENSISPILDEAPSEKNKLKSSKSTSEMDKIPLSSSVLSTAIRKPNAATLLSQNGSAIIRANKRHKSLSSTDSRANPSMMDNLPKHSAPLIIATVVLVLLFFSAGFLLYRIGIVKDKFGNSMSLEENVLYLKSGDDFYSEILKWQTQLHSKSAMQVHDFLNSNLEQIAKVRQSLETLSNLISGINVDNTHLHSSGYSDNKLSDSKDTVETKSKGQTLNGGKS